MLISKAWAGEMAQWLKVLSVSKTKDKVRTILLPTGVQEALEIFSNQQVQMADGSAFCQHEDSVW